ncbi:hypothetical protein SDJN03_29733, partial [Cucurbita argyrosperma subsp. sororia]
MAPWHVSCLLGLGGRPFHDEPGLWLEKICPNEENTTSISLVPYDCLIKAVMTSGQAVDFWETLISLSSFGNAYAIFKVWYGSAYYLMTLMNETPIDKQSDTRNLRIGIATYMAKTILEKFDPVSQTEYEKERLH